MPPVTCCTCALHLPPSPPLHPKTEKPLPPPRTLPCCSRIICSSCQHSNPRFLTYCPFCQISTSPSSALPPEGLRLPPSYTRTSLRNLRDADDSAPPSYDSLSHLQPPPPPPSQSQPHTTPSTTTTDVTHHLSSTDTLPTLSLLYSVPTHILLSHNRIPHSSLLSARKTLLIPSSHYTGPPLSTPPDPLEEERKNKLRRWMVATKCADYDVAGLYLKGADYDLELAVESWRGDERWERENPLKTRRRG